MRYRLRNQDDPNKTLGLTTSTWYGILERAQEFGWNPMGTILPEWEVGYLGMPGFEDLDMWYGEYWSDRCRLVVFEDALNMADALERATLAYEPEYIPYLTYYTLFNEHGRGNGAQPSLGAIQKVIELCELGTFQIERY